MARMRSPSSGVKVRMYRQGHGDCFLLAFAGREGRRKRDVYVLIDCGLKPKSEVNNQKIDRIIDDIHEATDGYVDVVVVTHEHQDHVNGFAKKKRGKHLFDKITFGQVWLAWTEDASDELANKLRERFRDTLVTLAFAQEKVAALHGTNDLAERLSDLLGAETGDDDITSVPGAEGGQITGAFRAEKHLFPLASTSALAAASIKGITNKKAMKYLRDRAVGGERFLRPDQAPVSLPYVGGLKVFALGPPRNEAMLLDLDPRNDEEFHLVSSSGGLALDGASRGFAQAIAPEIFSDGGGEPFSPRYRIRRDDVEGRPAPLSPELADLPPRERQMDYLRGVYWGSGPEAADSSAAWRRIDEEWLGAAEGLALRLNNEVNNTSLVLAFELPKSGRVLLFTGDAQRGNWIGWSDLKWRDQDGKQTTARDLLARCVLYKVGHHGSHNATLNGTDVDDYANIGWMARGAFAKEFVAMIPANTPWALGKSRPWAHPLPQIEKALEEKARGLVFRTDRDHVPRPDASVLGDDEWSAFKARTKEKDLYFEYSIEDV